MGLLSFFGAVLWRDVKEVKEKWITRDEFNKAIADQADDRKHLENTGNFRRLEDRITTADERHHSGALSIEKRLGEISQRIAELKPAARSDGPERRRGY